VSVAAGDGAALSGGEVALAVAEVEQFGVAAEDHGDQLGVAGQPPHRGR